MPAKPTAIIVGAGIAGLAAAWWLDNANWNTILIEKAASISSGGYVMTLSGPGLETITRMGLRDTLGTVTQDFEYNIVSTYSGFELYRLRYSDVHSRSGDGDGQGGIDNIAIRRNDLAQALLRALPASSTIRYSETILTAEDTGANITVLLKSGQKLTADLLIGADGMRSHTRDLFWKDHPALEPMGLYYAAYNYETPQSQKDTQHQQQPSKDCLSFNRPGQLDMVFALRDRGMTGYHIWHETRARLPPRDTSFTTIRHVTADSHPIVQDAVRRGESATASLAMDSLNLVILPNWSTGRVVLLGDAAHSLTLMSGQGASMALASAEVLSQELGRVTDARDHTDAVAVAVPDPDPLADAHANAIANAGTANANPTAKANTDIQQALRNHEARLRPAIERLQTRARDLAKFYVPLTWPQYILRNWMVWLTPRRWLVEWHRQSLRSEIDAVL